MQTAICVNLPIKMVKPGIPRLGVEHRRRDDRAAEGVDKDGCGEECPLPLMEESGEGCASLRKLLDFFSWKLCIFVDSGML